MIGQHLRLGWGQLIRLSILFVATLLDYGHFWLVLLHSTERRSADVQSIHLHNGNITEESVLWLQDSRDGLCLGPHGFGECGDVNFWRVWKAADETFRLEHVSSVYDSYEPLANISILGGGAYDANRQCFARFFTLRRGESAVGLTRCAELPYRASTRWTITADGRLANTMFGRSYCLRRVGGGNTALTGPCSRTDLPDFAILTPVVHLAVVDAPIQPKQVSSLDSGSASTLEPDRSRQQSSDASEPEALRCKRTGLVFPQRLHAPTGPLGLGETGSGGANQEGSSGDEGVPSALLVGPSGGSKLDFFGMGTYSKRYLGINVNVYTVALYVSASGLMRDPSIVVPGGGGAGGGSSFSGDEALFGALAQDAHYDRALYIQLALALSKDTLVQGLVEDLPLTQANKDAMLAAAGKLDLSMCPRGLTLLFLWRGTSSDTCPGCVDLFIDDQFLERVPASSGLGRDFFYQFVCDDPVSIEAKADFADRVRRKVESRD